MYLFGAIGLRLGIRGSNYSPKCIKEGYSKALKTPKGLGDSFGSTR